MASKCLKNVSMAPKQALKASISAKKEGPPARAALPLSTAARRDRLASRLMSTPRPHQRRASRSAEPATAGYDNETLDHLLSIVAGMAPYRGPGTKREQSIWGSGEKKPHDQA